MAINPLKAFLFIVGGSVAAAGTAYVSGALDPYLNRAPAEVASLTPPMEKPAEPGTDGPPPPAPATDAMAPAAPATADAIAPTFDIVRVEIKGSIVVAGKAAPNAKVEILNGSTVLGSTVAGADGAFAIVLDDPLKPGDYTIALRSMTGNVVTPSAQTAIVSIPKSPAGQVLAMIEEPGKASELLTVPTPETKPESPPAGDKAAAPAAEDSAVGDPSAATPDPAAPAATAPGTVEAAPAPDGPAAPASPVAGPKVVVEAIEIDGNKIFVAGLADPGRKVRAYANDILLGDAKTSPDGHFLVEATRNIPVGTYTIHVDALDADGVKVVARAAVPFEREPGESIAAVAPAEAKPAAPTTAPAAPAAEAPADVAAATPPAEVPETAAPKLEHADSAVIIRRHDTLWRISRRVYGQGVRYSTIYLANQDQIRNPDRIWPGQVFKVPGKSQEGEAANLKAMGDQMTTAPIKAN
ncbi:Ig-like domain-containing protein [Mesorhizobium sp.]|uniref:Ig-like domain-containing protein n=1 Tax=Mesorhizobium sp. TaxID=1871066 RepID=UPI000FE79119|nr:Ig-like domain-containing protein [Mesorhizobium sp.]RWK41598.1 MAG: LysM peptidoglycan-binding domain-containing protein [Mesorhizobium sp.]RWK69821.1 MAG: LysM peptidoglycan-binding domain-containing protein [Mesorhizobium sp.]RWK78791.1 MAG: LysM peptidoglycan-binding domain-containing protein [Mesorhizobium sp.]RWK80255.1 MAG: LysM peptidoglycan-binding domain-containing protein [Mesorhizobium sp.]RWL04503.1 MAG: LysM peptidoglycan-binding domain-containing protein [Mesorhizobium sp.]